MAIKSSIINAPLKGEINLSKNKLDVVAPNEGGYIKNDGVLYGNVLSPVYRKNGQSAFDYMDADKNKYNFSVENNEIKLEKGNTTILTASNVQFKKEEVSVPNVDSLYDKTHYIKVYSDRAVIIRGNDTRTVNGTIYATKMFDEQTAIVLYKSAFGVLNLDVYYSLEYPTGHYNVTPSLGGFELTAPIINAHKYTVDNVDYMTIAIVTDSGLSLGSHTTLLYCFDPTHGIHSMGMYNTDGTTETAKKIEKYLLIMQYSQSDGWDYVYNSSDKDYSQRLWFRGKTTSTALQVKCHWQATGTVPAQTAWAQDINESSSTEYTGNLVEVDDGEFSYENEAWQWVQTFTERNAWHHVDDAVLSSNENVKGFIWLSISSVVPWKDEYTQTEMDSMTNEVVKFKLCPRQGGTISNKPYMRVPLELPSTYVQNDPTIGRPTCAISEEATISSTAQTCDALLDDGTLIQTQTPSVDDDDVFTQGLFNFTGHTDHFEWDSTHNKYKLYYTISNSEAILLGQAGTAANAKYPYKLLGGSISLDNNYYRNNLVTEGIPYLDGEEEKKWTTTFLFDSGWENYKNQVLMQSGYESADNTLKAGSLVQFGNWRILYNNNLVSGISYSDNAENIGTLVTDWLTVSKILKVGTNEIFYLDNNGVVQRIYVEAENEVDYQIIRDRFIVINTVSYNNCWDLKTGSTIHWASDWNSRFFEGFAVPNKLQITANNTDYLNNTKVNDTVSQASAQNANYEMTTRSISSATFPPEVLNTVALGNTHILRGGTTEAIDFYRADEGLVVIYNQSYKNNVFYKDVSLEGAIYPLSDTASSSILYNPNIFTRFIRTYNNNDMAISDGTAYPLQKYNGNVIMLFLMVKGMENMQNVFVLQTLYYGIGDGKIWEIYYDNSTISNYQAIIDVNGMEYLGQLPTEALFWSPLNRSIYSFTGDAILKQLWHCNDISTINETFYNPATQELFISTDIGLLCVSNSYTYLLEGMKDVKEMFFYDTEFYVHNVLHPQTGDPSDEYYKVSYEWFENNDTKLNVKTKYFGSIENMKIHINAVYVRLYQDSNDTATFKIKEHTITDKSMSTDWKQCTINWDTDGWGYVRYQPQYQKGSSISFEMESTSPIVSISYGFTTLDENGMIGRNNI